MPSNEAGPSRETIRPPLCNPRPRLNGRGAAKRRSTKAAADRRDPPRINHSPTRTEPGSPDHTAQNAPGPAAT